MSKRLLIAVLVVFAVTTAVFAATISLVGSSSTEALSSNNAKGLLIQGSSSSSVTYQSSRLLVQAEDTPIAAPDFSAEISNRQGGDDIASATVIAAMPFSDTGHTTGYTDNYEEDACLGVSGPGNPDVVYAYTPDENELVTIALCESAFYTNLFVYETDATNLVDCNRFSSQLCTVARSGLVEVPMDSGVTYYIVVDGDATINPDEGDYQIDCSSFPAPFVSDSALVHPAIACAGNGYMMLGYEDKNIDTSMVWAGSSDDGASFPEAGAWATNGGRYTYPRVEYWGDDSVFYGTLTPSAEEVLGANTYLITFENPTIGPSWSQSSWGWDAYGWHDMRMADIAASNSFEFSQQPGNYKFGLISMVHSTTYTDPAMIDAPHLFYEIDTTIEGWASISWYPDFDGCQSTTIDIDEITNFSYAAYDRYDPDSSRWGLLIRRDNFADFDDETNAGLVSHFIGPVEHSEYPSIATHDGNILVAAEFSTDGAPGDHDIMLWYAAGSDYENLTTSVVVATTDDERFPELAHVSGDTYILTYIANNQLYMTISVDNGTTWDTPTVFSGADFVVSEYHAADISDRGAKIAWEYQPGLPGDISIFIHFGSTGLVVDSDGDGIDDDNDNCPTAFNPGQEDADGDTIGDACDDCTDTDADGYGNPGYAANTCAVDNCPDIANADQADADSDGIGDVCDDCTDTDTDGFGDPGFAANTCTVDNCPDISNPLQEDTNSDGLGDACCCIGFRSNVDGLDGEDPIITDLTFLVDYLFKGGPTPPCPAETNIDGLDGDAPIITDLTYLVDYLFKGGPAPASCL